ncbi:MAG: hypothetical protein PHS17_07755 [Desulfobacterales bacterium]|nr:hypothetical protein [Desulfobacterales bacterium]
MHQPSKIELPADPLQNGSAYGTSFLAYGMDVGFIPTGIDITYLSGFEFVSDFDIRYSDFSTMAFTPDR